MAQVGCPDDGSQVVQLEAKIAIEPMLVDFGRVQVGTEETRQVLVRNPGEATLELASVTPGDTFDASFRYVLDRMLVPPNGAAVITITYAPTEVGARSGRLVVRPSDSKLTDQVIDIRAEGVSTTLTVDPLILSYGNVVVGTRKRLDVTLTNTSEVEANVQFVPGTNVKNCASALADPARFCVSARERPFDASSSFRLGAGEVTKLEVEFEPEIAGTRELGEFSLKSCPLPACVQTVKLDGVGIETGFRCSPTSLEFGFVNPGSCLTKALSCENVANEPITVNDWRVVGQAGGQPSADYRPARPQVVTLQQGESTSIDVTYCPTALGDDRSALEIETNNIDPRLRFALVPLNGTGGGPDIEVVPGRLNFGQVSLIAPARRTVLVQNTGYADLTVTAIDADVARTGAFTATADFTRPIAPGQFIEVTVQFQPIAEGPIETQLEVRSDDQDENPIRIVLAGEGVNLPPCDFEVAPASLAFGVVERSRMISRSFEIRNIGPNECLITSARLVPGTDPAFSLPDGDVMSLRIPPLSSTVMRVLFSPSQLGDVTGRVEFSISSPSSPFNEIPLSGTGADATLLIVPNDLDFGTIGLGCAARARTITVYNTGASAVEIQGIGLSAPQSPAFRVLNLPALPFSLAPGGTFQFDVDFRTEQTPAAYASAVEITGLLSGMPATFIVSLVGRGALNAQQIDNFEQLGRPKVDILFVVDSSGSMGDEQAALGGNFSAFIQFAEAQQLDYQIAVTDTDVDGGGPQGTFLPLNSPNRIVNPSTQPSPEQVFLQNVNVGTIGSAFEQGLEASYLALSTPKINTVNAGFLRPDAVLSVIYVSDEEDQSPRAVDFYVNFLLSIKGFRNTNLFTASAIVGDPPSGCATSFGGGLRYIEVANRTGGIFQSICTADWSRALEELSTTAFGFKSRFFLTNQPVISTVKVYIDGVDIPATAAGGTVNWTYDYATNSVNFTPLATPEPGAQIRVEYTAECL